MMIWTGMRERVIKEEEMLPVVGEAKKWHVSQKLWRRSWANCQYPTFTAAVVLSVTSGTTSSSEKRYISFVLFYFALHSTFVHMHSAGPNVLPRFKKKILPLTSTMYYMLYV